MALPPQFDEPAGNPFGRVERMLDRGQSRVFRVLWFAVPPGSVVWNVQFQALMASRFLTDIALQALLYGALIAAAREVGSAADAALLGTAYLLPGVVLGMYGGIVADALPKRVALAGAYVVMGLLCFLIPPFLGTSFRTMLLILFAVRILHQVSQPSEASALPLVATNEELASATSFLSLASSTGEVMGKALLAPLIVRVWGVDPVVVLAGFLFTLSATRVFDLQTPLHHEPPPEPEAAERPRQVPTRRVVRWLLEERAVLWVLLLAALGATVNQVVGMLAPQYTGEALGVDPANALYVFAPAPLGLLGALAVAPALMAMFGERPVAILGFVIMSAVMVALGLIGQVTDLFGWVLFIDIPGVGPRVEMAAALSIFLGAGATFAAAATQTYLSRYMPLRIQGRAFALLGVMKDGLAIPPLLTLGIVADAVGVRAVLVAAPLVLIALAVFVDRLVSRFRTPPTGEVRGPAGYSP